METKWDAMMLFLLTYILLPLALAALNDCNVNQMCHNCTVSALCPTGTANTQSVGECAQNCTVWEDESAFGLLRSSGEQICYRYTIGFYLEYGIRKGIVRQTCRRDCSELEVKIFGSVKQTCDIIATYNIVVFGMDCLHRCLNTQSCTSIAYYQDSSDCVLNQHCNETTYSNNATSVITVTCLAAETSTLVTQTTLMTTAPQPKTSMTDTNGPSTIAMKKTSTVSATATGQSTVSISTLSALSTSTSAMANATGPFPLATLLINDTAIQTEPTAMHGISAPASVTDTIGSSTMTMETTTLTVSATATSQSLITSASVIAKTTGPYPLTTPTINDTATQTERTGFFSTSAPAITAVAFEKIISNMSEGLRSSMTTSARYQSIASSTSPTVSSLVPTSEQMRETSFSGSSATSNNHVTTADAHNSISSDGAQPTTNRITSNESYGVLSSTSHGVVSQIISTSETSIYDSSTTPVNHFTTSDALSSGFTGGNQHTTVGRQMSLKPGQGNTNSTTDFFGQPAGIAVASAGLAALLIIFGCLAWKLASSESGIMIQCYRVTV